MKKFICNLIFLSLMLPSIFLSADETKPKNITGEKNLTKKQKYEATPEYFASLKDDKLCLVAGKIYRSTKNQMSETLNNMEAEIYKRKLINDDSLAYIFKKSLRIGANECEIYAAFGFPDDINRSVNLNHVHKQFVYGRNYIYTDDGIVTSWQD